MKALEVLEEEKLRLKRALETVYEAEYRALSHLEHKKIDEDLQDIEKAIKKLKED